MRRQLNRSTATASVSADRWPVLFGCGRGCGGRRLRCFAFDTTVDDTFRGGSVRAGTKRGLRRDAASGVTRPQA